MSITSSELPGMWAEIVDRAGFAPVLAASNMADDFAAEVKRRLTALSHPRSTRTPSPPGEPPAKISGKLAGSVRPLGASLSRAAPSGDSAARSVAASTPYAASQERGSFPMRAHTSKGMRWQEPPGVWHRSMQHDLPQRSYMESTAELMAADGRLSGAAVDGWAEADIFAGAGAGAPPVMTLVE